MSAGMPEHPKIVAAGGDAAWLWFCILAYCKRNGTDGLFPASVVPRLSDRRQPMRLVARMVGERLAHEPGHDCKECPQPLPGRYVVHDYVGWQGSAAGEEEEADVQEYVREAKGQGGSYGNHRRWHVGRGVTDQACTYCAPSHMRSDERSVNGSHMRSGSDDITDRSPNRSPNRICDESDSEPPSPPQTPPHPRVDITPPTPQTGEPKRRTRRQAYDYATDQDFLRFWEVFPEKSGKPAAFKAWLAAKARGADPEVIIAAAEAYRDDPRRDPNKTKYPQGWLNDERYNDAPPAGGRRERNFDF